MAAVSRAVVCQDGDNRMTNKTNNSLTPVAQEAGGLPARTSKTPKDGKTRRVFNLDNILRARLRIAVRKRHLVGLTPNEPE
jgi:hypothetical protein